MLPQCDPQTTCPTHYAPRSMSTPHGASVPQGSTPSHGPSLGPRRGSPSQARAPVSPTGRLSLTPGGHLGAKQAEQQQREGRPARHGAPRDAQCLSREWRADGGGGRDTPGAGPGQGAARSPRPGLSPPRWRPPHPWATGSRRGRARAREAGRGQSLLLPKWRAASPPSHPSLTGTPPGRPL